MGICPVHAHGSVVNVLVKAGVQARFRESVLFMMERVLLLDQQVGELAFGDADPDLLQQFPNLEFARVRPGVPHPRGAIDVKVCIWNPQCRENA